MHTQVIVLDIMRQLREARRARRGDAPVLPEPPLRPSPLGTGAGHSRRFERFRAFLATLCGLARGGRAHAPAPAARVHRFDAPGAGQPTWRRPRLQRRRRAHRRKGA